MPSSREIIKELRSAGFKLDRINGSHHIFSHPEKGITIPVPHPKKDIKPGTASAIRKAAGLPDSPR